MKILIIDDNPAVRTTLKLLLADEFDSITAIGNPQLIPALLRNGEIDAVLLDMNFHASGPLDGSDGLFWLSLIKESPSPPAVVLITAFADVPLAVEAMRRGADDFVTKPWDNEQLLTKLHGAILRNRKAKTDTLTVSNAREIQQRDSARRAMTLDQLKLHHIREVVASCGGNLSAAAKCLGINRQTLYNLLKKS